MGVDAWSIGKHVLSVGKSNDFIKSDVKMAGCICGRSKMRNVLGRDVKSLFHFAWEECEREEVTGWCTTGAAVGD